MCVCVCVRERETHTHTDRQREQTAVFFVVCRFGRRKRRKKWKSNWPRVLATKVTDGTWRKGDQDRWHLGQSSGVACCIQHHHNFIGVFSLSHRERVIWLECFHYYRGKGWYWNSGMKWPGPLKLLLHNIYLSLKNKLRGKHTIFYLVCLALEQNFSWIFS